MRPSSLHYGRKKMIWWRSLRIGFLYVTKSSLCLVIVLSCLVCLLSSHESHASYLSRYQYGPPCGTLDQTQLAVFEHSFKTSSPWPFFARCPCIVTKARLIREQRTGLHHLGTDMTRMGGRKRTETVRWRRFSFSPLPNLSLFSFFLRARKSVQTKMHCLIHRHTLLGIVFYC